MYIYICIYIYIYICTYTISINIHRYGFVKKLASDAGATDLRLAGLAAHLNDSNTVAIIYSILSRIYIIFCPFI